MKTFKDLVHKERKDGPIYLGTQACMFFDNGYGVSVIKGPYTYGGENGLYELAVLEGNEEEACITYATPITDDVVGHLTARAVTTLMKKVQKLPLYRNGVTD